MLGIRYGSPESFEIASKIMSAISEAASESTLEIAARKGDFPLAKQAGCRGRNSHLTSIAPTGTISLIAGNVSGGIEPLFSKSYTRKVLLPDGSHRTETVEDYAVRLARHMGLETEGEAWVTAQDLSIDDHLGMMAAVQKHVDSSISKTVNCPAEMPFGEFQAVYKRAYDLGLKSCATYRPSSVRGSILSIEKPEADPASSNVVRIADPVERPDELHGSTYKVKPAGTDHALYVTINDIDMHGRKVPFEIFLSSKEVDGQDWRLALSRMISAVFRKGGDFSFVADELQQIHNPRGGHWIDGKYVPSQPAAIGDILRRHLDRIDGISVKTGQATRAVHCPKCQTGSLVFREGCSSCDGCGYSKCG
jgi:ribonucleoside-diphosphate reductase alpha chain